ncbi:DNA helicase [Thermosipho melanesiensis]|uniref:Replicative DNA helicase n=2 Tax=Thermosipho melanesiensis TaxID=46541 RepID=A6LKD3_THEM4|nr:replicative DNA helicase [Thermosipho melanesiensis]ABR30384.1 replicative DNA helicase [Thermosipho melanesiensis BI429]APT73546.1 DNA helicase [Thermosipho melanesiensis]OOC37497.1 DNA helicase [Thermosipho melanesiensis]OOC39576.1 DNA helicase [Thermosipho melanesiensis]OOC39615.1 DNA helicase [Thermosipho melanesiensis]
MRNSPHNIEAERAVIGSILINPETVEAIVPIVSSRDFYDPKNVEIFKVIEELYDEGIPIDLISICDRLRTKGKLEFVGGELYVAQLADIVPTSAHVETYAQIVRDKSILRALISAASKVVEDATSDRDVDDILDDAERLIFEIAESKTSKTYLPMNTILHQVFENIESLREKNKSGTLKPVTGIPTGYTILDEMTSGFHKSDLIILAARPSVGKTAFALNIARNMAIEANIPVGIFSLEMSKEQLAQRLLGMEAFIELQKIRRGNISDEEWQRLLVATDRLYKANIIVDDEANLDPRSLRAKARRMKKEYGVEVIFVDYLQLMSTKSYRENRQQEISEISRSLKLLARELNIVIVALSQLSRAVEQREDKRPRLSDLRESGSIEQDADMVLFLYREEYYKKEKTTEPHITEVLIGKQRNGPIGTVKLSFDPKYTAFYNIDLAHGG